jgi:hypothetical protein
MDTNIIFNVYDVIELLVNTLAFGYIFALILLLFNRILNA